MSVCCTVKPVNNNDTYATPSFINEALHLAIIKMSLRNKVMTLTALSQLALLGWFGDVLGL